MESDIPDWSEGFKRMWCNTHITALKIWNNSILVAQGNEVLVYDWKLKTVLHRRIVFEGCSIHGIRISTNCKCLFFGAKHIAIIPYVIEDSEESNFRFKEDSQHMDLKDWILDVQWISKSGENDYAISALTAHNALFLLKETGDIIQTFQCAENCILYSASIISCDYQSLVLAVGTVFQKILLWSPFSGQNDAGKNVPFKQLSGHQGVIFSVAYHEGHKIICSTSDDRSLRVWKVQSKDQHTMSLEFWENSTIDQIHVLYAHESRVWRSVILDSCILSIGEDSYICFWSLKGTLLNKFKRHREGSIWCIETCCPNDKNQENAFAFTGGSDGSVCIWDVTKAIQKNPISLLSKESDVFRSRLSNQNADRETNVDEQLSAQNQTKQEKGNFPRSCSLYTERNDENIVVYMGTEKLSVYNLKSKSWADIFIDSSIANYCIVLVSSVGKFVALGTISGELILIHMQGRRHKAFVYKKFQIHKSMICSLNWCDDKNNYLLSCTTEGRMALWFVSYEGEFKIHCLQQYFLVKCKNHWWSTAALYLHMKAQRFLFVGDRGGNISVYENSDELNEKKWLDPIRRFPNVHVDGVTDIQVSQAFIYSSGRDGKVIQWFILEGYPIQLHSLKVSHDLEWIGKVLFFRSDILFIGFHANNFVVWSHHLESTVMTVECGGGHRSWDFSLSEEGVATFVAIQKKDVIFYQQNINHMLEESELKVGVSGHKMCCLIYLSSIPNQNVSFHVLLCGGEDNTLRVLAFFNNRMHGMHKLSGHVSNIRAITKEKMVKNEEWLVASVGGRSQIILWKFKFGIIVEQLNSTFLLGSDEKSKSKSKENTQIESQTRIMDVSMSPSRDCASDWEYYDVGVACSDSYFRLYKFDVYNRELILSHTLQHDENCILKVVSDVCSVAAYLDISYITAATNGSLKILKHERDSEDEPTDTLAQVKYLPNCHKSGINALDLKFLCASIWMICSGGDDNSLMVAFIDLNALPSVESNIKVVSKYYQLNAHASQITGVKILDPYTIVSTSVDQRLNIWQLNYINSPGLTVTINLYKSLISVIPDIANLECWRIKDSEEWMLAVCGQGFEVFSFIHEEKLDYKELILHFLQDCY